MAVFTIKPLGYESSDNTQKNITVHPSAFVHKNAILNNGCIIGPFCIVGENVTLHENVHLMSNVIVEGDTIIGTGTVVYPFVVIGVPPQDLKYAGEAGKIVIGSDNRIREHCTIHLPTLDGGSLTSIGNSCLLMVNAHVAHDVHIGNSVIIANNVMLGGHAQIQNNVIIGGGTAVHQFCRIGESAFIGGVSGIVQDIVPYALYTGIRDTGVINGINFVGLRRKGYSKEDLNDIRSCYDIIFDKNVRFAESLEKANLLFKDSKAAYKIVDFILNSTSKSIVRNYRQDKPE